MLTIHVREDIDDPDPNYPELYRRLGDWPDAQVWIALAKTGGCTARRILDLGCGTGGLSLPLARAGFEVWGVDAQPGMINIAKEARHPQTHFIVGRIERMTLPVQFDLIVLSPQLVNTMPEEVRSEVLFTAASHLGPAGRLVVGIASEWFRIAEDSQHANVVSVR